MKKKIKLRDMTWDECCAIEKECEKERRSLSYHGVTFSPEEAYRLKTLFPKEMMDEEVEIEAPDILTPEEKEYLEAVIEPFRSWVKLIEKINWGLDDECLVIAIDHYPEIPIPTTNYLKFEGIAKDNSYTLEELGL